MKQGRHHGWWVDGKWYAHSAAKFWPRLLDDVKAGCPGWRVAELTTFTEAPLDRDLLSPLNALRRGLLDLAFADVPREMARTLAELEMTGPPAGVTLHCLGPGGTVLETRALPDLDGEVFANLVVWLLEWAGIPDALWNHGDIAIGISASGNSPNVLKAIKYANDHGGKTIGLCGFGGGELARMVDLNIAFSSHDYGVVEDMHLVLNHLISQIFRQRLSR